MQKPLLAPRQLAALIVGASLLTTFPALAESPLNTDDAGTLAVGSMKIEGLWSRDDRRHGVEMQFGFSPIENLEISLALAQAKDRSDNPSTQLRGQALGIKWVPIQNDSGWSLGLSFNHGRTRINERAVSERHSEREYALTGLASYRFDNRQVVHINLGSTRIKTPDGSDTLGTWNLGYEFPLMERLQLTAETFGVEHSRPDKAIGLRYEIFEGCKLSAAFGRGNSRSFAQAGLSWEF